MEFVEVAVPLAVHQTFTYSVPDNLRDVLRPGCRVMVRLGKQLVCGLVMSPAEPPAAFQAIPVYSLLDAEPVITPHHLKLITFIANYYLTPIGEVFRSAYPNWANPKSKKRILRIIPPNELPATLGGRALQVYRFLQETPDAPLSKLIGEFGSEVEDVLRDLERRGALVLGDGVSTAGSGVQKMRLFRFVGELSQEEWEALERKSPRQAFALRAIADRPSGVSAGFLREQLGVPAGILTALIRKEWVIKEEKVVERSAEEAYLGEKFTELTLTPDQQTVLGMILEMAERPAEERHPILLHGVTGSGKTQVYLEAIDAVLRKGKQGLVLVPEISLTPQIAGRFRNRFGSDVAIVHSGLSQGERLDAWNRIRHGQARVVVGVRSAIFAPLPDPGLLIVDEEHEATYKQEEGAPRYHARDSAVVLGQLTGAVVLLGSATPSLESLYNVQLGRYALAELPRRITERPMPEVHIEDLRIPKPQPGEPTPERKPVLGGGFLSQRLMDEIKLRLERKESIILLLNRRGFSTVLQCRTCGYRALCPNCDVTLTYHLHDLHLKCHYCGHEIAAPSTCPACAGTGIKFSGVGTQRIERELNILLPGVPVLRMDQDTTRTKGAHAKVLRRFADNPGSILLGTQMVAKGLDFAAVTLVGVILADMGLYVADFRAGERIFQLLTQVAGRSGRGLSTGEVVFQTFSPSNPILQLAAKHDYIGFATLELDSRKEHFYPPYSRLYVVLAQGKDEIEVQREAQAVAILLREQVEGEALLQVLGPAPSPMSRLRGLYRWQILVKAARTATLQKRMHAILASLQEKRGPVTWTVNVDPIGLM